MSEAVIQDKVEAKEVAAVENGGNTVDKQAKDQLPQSLFVQHMSTYPAVSALTGLVGSFPVPKMFLSNALPLLMAMSSRAQETAVAKRVGPMLVTVDRMGDDLLTRVDKRFPSLATAQPSDLVVKVSEPVRRAQVRVYTVGEAAVRNGVLYPLKGAAKFARSQYSRVYDNGNKALVRSLFDPIVGPLNERLIAMLPPTPAGELESNATVDGPEPERPAFAYYVQIPPSSEVSNELSRTWRLVLLGLQRTGPLVAQGVSDAVNLPAATLAQVRQVYAEKEKVHRGDRDTTSRRAQVLAALGTTRELADRGREFITSRLTASPAPAEVLQPTEVVA